MFTSLITVLDFTAFCFTRVSKYNPCIQILSLEKLLFLRFNTIIFKICCSLFSLNINLSFSKDRYEVIQIDSE